MRYGGIIQDCGRPPLSLAPRLLFLEFDDPVPDGGIAAEPLDEELGRAVILAATGVNGGEAHDGEG